MDFQSFLNELNSDFKVSKLSNSKALISKNDKTLEISSENMKDLRELNNKFIKFFEIEKNDSIFKSTDFFMNDDYFKNFNGKDSKVDLKAPPFSIYDPMFPGDKRNKKKNPFDEDPDPDNESKPEYDSYF